MTSTIAPRLVLFARYPTPGTAKTRLIPALGAIEAARVHRDLTERTIRTMASSGLTVEVRYTGGPMHDFSAWLGEDIALVEQVDGDLSDRLIAALDPAPVIFFGADTPDLSSVHVNQAIEALRTRDVVIGPAEDGGYYLIGVASPHRFLFEAMPWSTDRVYPETLSRLQSRSLVPAVLETLSDCDRPEDLARWPWLSA
jgi:uncharacterized protein